MPAELLGVNFLDFFWVLKGFVAEHRAKLGVLGSCAGGMPSDGPKFGACLHAEAAPTSPEAKAARLELEQARALADGSKPGSIEIRRAKE